MVRDTRSLTFGALPSRLIRTLLPGSFAYTASWLFWSVQSLSAEATLVLRLCFTWTFISNLHRAYARCPAGLAWSGEPGWSQFLPCPGQGAVEGDELRLLRRAKQVQSVGKLH